MPAPETLSVDIALARRGGFTVEARFEAAPGITILFGPSGSGKSTILGAIAGIERPDRGRIALGAGVWFDSEQRIHEAIHRRRIAFVFQSLALFPHMTALGNVLYGMPKDGDRDAARTRATAMLDKLKVGHLRDRRPPTFSGGEGQRVAIARAFAMSPRVVLFDEPFSAMDQSLRRDLVGELRSFVDELGVPMIHVTHHRNEARALGDRVILLEKGRIMATGGVELLPERHADEDMDDEPMARSGRRGA